MVLRNSVVYHFRNLRVFALSCVEALLTALYVKIIRSFVTSCLVVSHIITVYMLPTVVKYRYLLFTTVRWTSGMAYCKRNNCRYVMSRLQTNFVVGAIYDAE